MKRWFGMIAFAALLLVGVGLLAFIFNLRQGAGDVYPVYASQRADPLGTRLLYDALSRQPGLSVERSTHPLSRIKAAPPRCIVIAGVELGAWNEWSAKEFNALEEAMQAGCRVIITFRPLMYSGKELEDPGSYRPSNWLREEERIRPRKPEARQRDVRSEREPKGPERAPENGNDREAQGRRLARELWGVELHAKTVFDRDYGVLSPKAGFVLRQPDIPWRSAVFVKLSTGTPARVAYQRVALPLLVEIPRGKGTLVLATDTYFLTNEALGKAPEVDLLSWLIGDQTHVVFEEEHLGVHESKGVSQLARRYGLLPGALLLIVLALLYFWREGSSLVPLPEERSEQALPFHSTAGLVALLRRSIPRSVLFDRCLKEWQRTASHAEKERVESLSSSDPVAAYNEANRRLRHPKPSGRP